MEIHEAIADFSEDIVLAYLKQCSEAVGNLTSELTAGDGEKYGSSDDDEEEGEHTKGSSRTEEAEVFSVRVKDRAKSIDSGVCVDPRKAEQTENGEREKCRGNHSKSRESENSSQEDGAFSSLGACKCPDYEDSDEDWDKPKSLVMSFKKGDLFAVSDDRLVSNSCLFMYRFSSHCIHVSLFHPSKVVDDGKLIQFKEIQRNKIISGRGLLFQLILLPSYYRVL